MHVLYLMLCQRVLKWMNKKISHLNWYRFQQALIDAFAELKRMTWLNGASVLIRNLLFPFRHYGLLGSVACIVVYPLVIPISVLFCFVYALPVVFLSCRIVRHIFAGPQPPRRTRRAKRRRQRLYGARSASSSAADEDVKIRRQSTIIAEASSFPQKSIFAEMARAFDADRMVHFVRRRRLLAFLHESFYFPNCPKYIDMNCMKQNEIIKLVSYR